MQEHYLYTVEAAAFPNIKAEVPVAQIKRLLCNLIAAVITYAY